MKLPLRSLALTAASAAAAGGLALTTVTPANADEWTMGNGQISSSCSGVVKRSGSLAGGKFTYKVYYSTANGGTNCIKLWNHTGKRVYMDASIWDRRNNRAYDTGYFSSYAGASSIKRTNGVCISFYVKANYAGQSYSHIKWDDLCR